MESNAPGRSSADAGFNCSRSAETTIANNFVTTLPSTASVVRPSLDFVDGSADVTYALSSQKGLSHLGLASDEEIVSAHNTCDKLATEQSHTDRKEDTSDDKKIFDQHESGGDNPSSGLSAKLKATSDSGHSREKYVNEEDADYHCPTSGCLFLDKLSLDIRDQIYRCLLLSPELNNIAPLHTADPVYGYDLSPAILCVCKQIYEEGSRVLYAENVFLAVCLPHSVTVTFGPPGTLNFSDGYGPDGYGWVDGFGEDWYHKPSGRNVFASRCHLKCRKNAALTPINRLGGDRSIFDYPQLKKVRQWNVLVTTSVKQISKTAVLPQNIISELCAHLSNTPPRSLKILMVPQWVEERKPYLSFDRSGVLECFQLLRHVESVAIRDAGPTDGFEWEALNNRTCAITSPMEEEETKEAECFKILESKFEDTSADTALANLISGDTHVERGWELYQALLAYAQSFERHEKFKADMAIGRCTNSKRYKPRLYNPFQGRGYKHPVERGLLEAKKLQYKSNTESLRMQISNVVEYLENQYNAVVETSSTLYELIKQEKREGGIFDVTKAHDIKYLCKHKFDALIALTALLRHASSFRRHTEFTTEVSVLLQGRSFDDLYNDMPRERLLQDLQQDVKGDIYDDFLRKYKLAVDDMNSQLIEISKARKDLFAFDMVLHGQSTFKSPGYCLDEMVDWTVNEPNTCPSGHPQTSWWYPGMPARIVRQSWYSDSDSDSEALSLSDFMDLPGDDDDDDDD